MDSWSIRSSASDRVRASLHIKNGLIPTLIERPFRSAVALTNSLFSIFNHQRSYEGLYADIRLLIGMRTWFVKSRLYIHAAKDLRPGLSEDKKDFCNVRSMRYICLFA